MNVIKTMYGSNNYILIGQKIIVSIIFLIKF